MWLKSIKIGFQIHHRVNDFDLIKGGGNPLYCGLRQHPQTFQYLPKPQHSFYKNLLKITKTNHNCF